MDFVKRKIGDAENGWMMAKKEIDNAIYELGKAYYEANKENPSPEFAGQIQEIQTKRKAEYLWHQYRLSLDGQRMCESCGSFITADSAFCNRCGAALAPIDFSPILGAPPAAPTADNTARELFCPKCGSKLVEGAMFCESCGTKVGGN